MRFSSKWWTLFIVLWYCKSIYKGLLACFQASLSLQKCLRRIICTHSIFLLRRLTHHTPLTIPAHAQTSSLHNFRDHLKTRSSWSHAAPGIIVQSRKRRAALSMYMIYRLSYLSTSLWLWNIDSNLLLKTANIMLRCAHCKYKWSCPSFGC